MKCPKCHSDNPDTQRFCGDCGIQLPSSEEISVSPTETLETFKKELTTGSTFAGRYQIIEELGKGGMGKVYKALDSKIKEKIALKLIKPEIASNKKIIELMGRIEYNIFTNDGNKFIEDKWYQPFIKIKETLEYKLKNNY